MKTTVEIDDTLDERVEDAKKELRENIIEWVRKEKPETYDKDDVDALIECWYQGDDKETYGCDLMSELADSNTPIYTKEIEDTWYLYRNELTEAYENAGIGKDSNENNGMTAIYCYISEALHESYRDMFTEAIEEYQSDNAVKQA